MAALLDHSQIQIRIPKVVSVHGCVESIVVCNNPSPDVFHLSRQCFTKIASTADRDPLPRHSKRQTFSASYNFRASSCPFLTVASLTCERSDFPSGKSCTSWGRNSKFCGAVCSAVQSIGLAVTSGLDENSQRNFCLGWPLVGWAAGNAHSANLRGCLATGYAQGLCWSR